jgi:hypothetical protein
MGADPGLLLGATALGGAISLSTTYAMARRGENAAARATARILRDDLLWGTSMTMVSPGEQEMVDQRLQPPTRSWHEDRSPLARSLSDDEWRILARAFYEMDVTSAAVAAIYANLPSKVERGWAAPSDSESAQKRLEMTQDAMRDALQVLNRFSRKGVFRALGRNGQGAGSE